MARAGADLAVFFSNGGEKENGGKFSPCDPHPVTELSVRNWKELTLFFLIGMNLPNHQLRCKVQFRTTDQCLDSSFSPYRCCFNPTLFLTTWNRTAKNYCVSTPECYNHVSTLCLLVSDMKCAYHNFEVVTFGFITALRSIRPRTYNSSVSFSRECQLSRTCSA
ncbi:uncharacterized protein BO97DRAFT_54177 [Aspergillus homomorphus CBS 101889]|uniref:Uncharacterized protein n=1 Tax=Aspergillus homomorphus (strain CBS 101889) TaxID=1450537 RepID=A0A395HXV2_ASPHC|nr:hypothetical protein BO97DRAFT_54177 [Aspergillus homomorphus CBS 101889]RAL12752.1 hypothetical protein BO97DRAFT_54177 [Aspergillus homomorphus CBS 101889]